MTNHSPQASAVRQPVHLTFDLGMRKLLPIVFRPFLRPPLDVLSRSAQCQSTNAFEVMSELLGCTDTALEQLSAEYRAHAWDRAASRSESNHFPTIFDLDAVHALAIYWVIRTVQPNQVVESGVANGVSSRAILLALDHNDRGELHSFEISNGVGALVEERLRPRWTVHTAPGTGRASFFRREMSRISQIDVFLHDSEHTYAWQLMEFNTAWRFLKVGGLLAADDIDSSYAFQDFSRKMGVKGFHVVAGRKVFGCVRK